MQIEFDYGRRKPLLDNQVLILFSVLPLIPCTSNVYSCCHPRDRSRGQNLAKLATKTYALLVRFVFDIRKGIAATAYLCKLNGGKLNVLHLIKMLYQADRTALVDWHRTITGDRFVSMRNGPVLSKIYDLMCGRVVGPHMEAWNSVFRPRDGNTISLKTTQIDLGPLSQREIEALDIAFKKFRKVPVGRLVEFLHKTLPEWTDPGDSSKPIDPKEILFDAGLSPDEVAEIEEELAFFGAAKKALQAC